MNNNQQPTQDKYILSLSKPKNIHWEDSTKIWSVYSCMWFRSYTSLLNINVKRITPIVFILIKKYSGIIISVVRKRGLNKIKQHFKTTLYILRSTSHQESIILIVAKSCITETSVSIPDKSNIYNQNCHWICCHYYNERLTKLSALTRFLKSIFFNFEFIGETRWMCTFDKMSDLPVSSIHKRTSINCAQHLGLGMLKL